MNLVESISPQQPLDIVCSVAESTLSDVHKAARAARAAQRAWAAALPSERSAALGGAADTVASASEDLVALVIREVGKPRSEAEGEVSRAVSILRYFAQQVYDPIGAVHMPSAASGLAFTRRRPRGVAGLITPWNFPLAIPLWKAAPALAFGNAVLLKPAPQSSACALRLQELLAVHFPPGLLQVLAGGAAVGSALIEVADVLSFTGSAAVGSQIAAAAAGRGIPVQCEMGGQNPAIVLPDANVGAAAKQIALAAYGFAGQKCTATKRIVVVGQASEFVHAFIAETEGLKVADPSEPGTTVGPVIDERARDRVRDAIAGAKNSGGRILTGGDAEIPIDGWYVRPTAVDGLPPSHELLQEEVFGPICAIVSVDTVDQALEVANETGYGLAASVHSNDLDSALLVSELLNAGQIKLNAPTTGVDFFLPFGGEGKSSYGQREQGKAALEFYTSLHTVTMLPSK